MLAYEGGSLPAPTRSALVDRYVDEVLDGWLELIRVSAEERRAPVEEVRRRLRALARRWDQQSRSLLLAPYMEVAESHEPSEVPRELRALAVVGVRNSDLETLHLADHIHQYDWRVLTGAAAFALSDLPSLPVGDCGGDDPFDGVIEDHPTATAAFAALVRRRPGNRRRGRFRTASRQT
jgi:hypothetical protein